MTNVYVVLLRGINVGRAKRIAMAELRTLVENLGCRDVRTLLNSGNIVLRTTVTSKNKVAARIEKAIERQLGVSTRVIALNTAEMNMLIRDNPIRDAAGNPSRLLVAVPEDPEHLARLRPLEKKKWGTDVLAVGNRAAYIWCPDGILGSKLPESVGRALGDGVTMRNWSTVSKLYSMIGEPEADEG